MSPKSRILFPFGTNHQPYVKRHCKGISTNFLLGDNHLDNQQHVRLMVMRRIRIVIASLKEEELWRRINQERIK